MQSVVERNVGMRRMTISFTPW